MILFVSLFVCLKMTMQTESQARTNIEVKKAEELVILVNEQELSETIFHIGYEIRNNYSKDVWICASVNVNDGCDFEIYMDYNIQTLMIRRRLDVPSDTLWFVQPFGKYIRLHPGEKRTESLSLSLPVRFKRVYMEYQETKEIEGITHVAIEIGYYVGDLPKMFDNMLKETEKTDLDTHILFDMEFGGVLGFNDWNERLIKRRDEEVLIPYTEQKFKGEEVLRAVIDDIKIPYEETIKSSEINPPEMNTCTKVEIQYQPSMLEYFFPYESQRSLFTSQEIEYLQSQNNIVLKDKKVIDEFANEVKQTKHTVGGIVSEKSNANVSVYHNDRQVTSFIVYDDSCVENKQKQRLRYRRKNLHSLKKFTPQIQPFELRMWCACNLRNLWYRLRLYDRQVKRSLKFNSNLSPGIGDPNKPKNSGPQTDMAGIEEFMQSFREEQEIRKMQATLLRDSINLVYPVPPSWCDAMGRAFAGMIVGSKRREDNIKMKVHVCPSVGKGMSTYAMNPNCRYESPPDMVLLFETKAGWNQHGGPELFTFDNHDPKGGCVLLNDGTVKFIRTKEELQKLRWK